MLKENEKIDLTQFSDSELKIIGALMNSGLETGKYSEEQLKALAIFVKADIAGQSLDLSNGNRKQVKVEDLSENDEVYGTVELHKTTPTEDGYKEIKLKYVPYSTFRSMVESSDIGVMDCFSINGSGKLVIAKSSSMSIKYTYLGGNGKELSNEDKGKIDSEYIGEDEEIFTIKEYLVSIDYKQYIKKYIANYGFLSDLLIATNNANFCVEIAELALNSKIVINLREEKTTTYTYDKTTYTQTSLVYNYFNYTVIGYDLTQPSNKPVESGSKTIPGKEEFKYTIIVESSSENYKYDIDISEIDGWYLKYKRPYAPPEVTTTSFAPPKDVEGEYPDEATVVPSTIASNKYVQAFILQKEQECVIKWNVDAAICTVTQLSVEQKTKTSSKVEEYVGTRTTYKFGDESDIDTTKAEFKNIEYINDVPTFTNKDKKGFLYIYDKYITGGIDLCLHNDAEKQFFEMLESDEDTVNISDVMRFLLYIYDGIDRGITDLDKYFKVIDMSLVSNSGRGVSPFGCPLTREEFIEATRNYQGDSILATLAEKFYDICTLPEYNVNPCLAYIWAAYESGWGKSAVNDKNLFQMGTYTDQTSGKKYSSYDESIKDFCGWVVSAADLSSSLYSMCYSRAQEYATVNKKFEGTPDKNIYALFSTFAWVGYTHTGNARACIRMTYEYLSDRAYICNHADSDDTTMQERADYMEFIISSRIDLAKTVFGKNCFMGHGSIVEAAYEVADHFMNSGVDVHYAAAHKGGNNILLPDAFNIQDCYDKPLENPAQWGIVCTTFVNLALWKAEIIDTETMNGYNIHSPVYSDMMLKSLDGWEIITDYDDLQEGDVVYSENHTWIYVEGGKMLDQSYCVINSNGSDTRGILKNPNRGKFIRGFRYVGS
ncbi:MAG: glucosaminidase domain-containing protein [Clostridia bacterium]